MVRNEQSRSSPNIEHLDKVHGNAMVIDAHADIEAPGAKNRPMWAPMVVPKSPPTRCCEAAWTAWCCPLRRGRDRGRTKGMRGPDESPTESWLLLVN